MKFIANENIPLASVNVLKLAGFDIVSVGNELSGITDKEVMDIAVKEERTIITLDKDYGELVFKYGYKPAAGVIIIRWQNFEPEEPGNYLKNLFTTADINYNYAVTIIDKSSLRQRKY